MKLTSVIEIPYSSFIKYEIKNGILVADRINTRPCPANYGFVPNTMCDDGDPLDIFVTTDKPEYGFNYVSFDPHTRVKVVPYAVIKLLDNGEQDDKLVASIDGKFKPVDNILYYLTNYKKGIVIQSISLREKDINEVIEKAFEDGRKYSPTT